MALDIRFIHGAAIAAPLLKENLVTINDKGHLGSSPLKLTTLEDVRSHLPSKGQGLFYNSDTLAYENRALVLNDISDFALENGQGTTANGVAVNLGGNFAENIDISSLQGASFGLSTTHNLYGSTEFSLFPDRIDLTWESNERQEETNSNLYKSGVEAYSQKAILYFENNQSSIESKVEIGRVQALLQVRKDTQRTYLSLGATSPTVFKDQIYEAGIKYSKDYSDNFTSRSLVDKAYVDNAIKGGVNDSLYIGEEDSANSWKFSREGNNLAILYKEEDQGEYIPKFTIKGI